MLPTLGEPLSWAKAVAAPTDGNALKLLPWEESRDGPSLLDALEQFPQRNEIHLLIGPEGGFSADEVNVARAAGWRTVSLGPNVLRAETASLAAVAVAMAAAMAASSAVSTQGA